MIEIVYHVAAILKFCIKEVQYVNTPRLHRVLPIIGVMRRKMEQLLHAAVLRKSVTELAAQRYATDLDADVAVCASAEEELLIDALSRISFGNSSAFVIHPLHVVAAMRNPLSARLLFVTESRQDPSVVVGRVEEAGDRRADRGKVEGDSGGG
jgi:hypothetical protein